MEDKSVKNVFIPFWKGVHKKEFAPEGSSFSYGADPFSDRVLNAVKQMLLI